MRITKAKVSIYKCLPRVNAIAICAIEVRLQSLTGLQFDICDDEVQLQSPLITMLNP